MLKCLSVVMLASLALACGGDRPMLRVSTNGTSFQRELVPSTSASPVAYVPYDSWNHGNATAFLPTCGTRVLPAVERYANGQWESYAGGFCMLSSVMVPLELREGATHHDEVAISEAGHYRIRVSYSSDGQLRNHFESVSGSFDVH